MLLLLLAVPALVVGYLLLLRRRKKGVVRYASLTPDEGRARPRATVPPPRPAAALPARADRRDHRDRPAERRDHAAVAGADDRAGDGRVAQHGRQGRRPQPAHRGAVRPRRRSSKSIRRMHGSRSSPSAQRRRSCRRRRENQRGPARGDRPLSAAARHRDRQRALRGARDALPRCRNRSRIAGVQGRAVAQHRVRVLRQNPRARRTRRRT